MHPSQIHSESWIHDLAFAEKNAEIGKLIDVQDFKKHIKMSTLTFLDQLKQDLSSFLTTFNTLSENGTAFDPLKIYQVAQSTTDFMLYRNRFKLVFRSPSAGLIQIAYAESPHTHLPSFQESPESPGPAELLAQIGPFQEVHWSFQGDRIQSYQVAKYYFTQFITVTRKVKEATHNQALFDQIKAFLKEKGVELPSS